MTTPERHDGAFEGLETHGTLGERVALPLLRDAVPHPTR